MREHQRSFGAWAEKVEAMGIPDKEANQLMDQHKAELEEAQKLIQAIDKK